MAICGKAEAAPTFRNLFYFKSTSLKLLVLLITYVSSCCIIKLCSWKLIGFFFYYHFYISYHIFTLLQKEVSYKRKGLSFVWLI